MKLKLFLPLIGVLALSGCTPTTSESPGSSVPPITSESTTDSSITSEATTDPSVVSEVTTDPSIASEEISDSSETSVPPVVDAAIQFGADPFAGTSLTGVAGVGVALYFDATENDVPVNLDRVTFTIEPKAAVLFAPQIGYITKLGVYYYRALEPGGYTITLTVKDSAGLNAVRHHEVTVSSGDLSGNQTAIKAAIGEIYPTNIATMLDYRASEGVFNEWVVVGKDFTVFERVDNSGNYATVFVPFARFEGAQPLLDFTISFKYTTLNSVWKLLFSFWTGEAGNDGFAGDYLRLLTNRNAIGIQGDAQQNSEFQDEGEATDIPLKEGPVWIKFTRQVENVNKVTFKLYTSTDNVTYALKTTVVLTNQDNSAGQTAAKITGFLPFSIDNDFIIENLAVSSTVFTI